MQNEFESQVRRYTLHINQRIEKKTKATCKKKTCEKPDLKSDVSLKDPSICIRKDLFGCLL